MRNRKCTITGRTSIEWDLTDKLPLNIKIYKKTKKDRISEAVTSLLELHKKKNVSTNEDWIIVADLIKSI